MMKNLQIVVVPTGSCHTGKTHRSIAAGRALFFSLMKRTKNQVRRDASLPHLALCAANQIKPKARSFCRRLPQALASGKITNAFAGTQPCLFYLISPEAARLTVRIKPEF
ncbi:hypothetical protein [Mucilaginibacter sp. UR6-11]|uniref:hypothetical protein n=1 Tax=Mucilaginibacter sp. UR6-11 TaxID=1435644 RepID=UPI001E3AF483|nr:hypothetical protein [Mucilaginibacter sp. UR6-11]MCC8424116.1 hypothetical protein [Mucilaginibacter sp. UR6-11]